MLEVLRIINFDAHKFTGNHLSDLYKVVEYKRKFKDV